jgi:peptidyl-prolyl cis-trans isomerase B (cyclophilin B)
MNYITRKTCILLLCLIFCAVVVPSTYPASVSAEAQSEYLTGTHYVAIEVRDYGTIEAELYADLAPATVTNFLHLADQGFYDGLTFHRIISGFMIQGGDPNGNGTGGSDQTIPGEFAANGFENSLSHTRGVLSMARARAYDSASSQFFICHADAVYLDGGYAAFGRVLSGMDVVDAICASTPVTDANGTVRREDQPVILHIHSIDAPSQDAAANHTDN